MFSFLISMHVLTYKKTLRLHKRRSFLQTSSDHSICHVFLSWEIIISFHVHCTLFFQRSLDQHLFPPHYTQMHTVKPQPAYARWSWTSARAHTVRYDRTHRFLFFMITTGLQWITQKQDHPKSSLCFVLIVWWHFKGTFNIKVKQETQVSPLRTGKPAEGFKGK